VFGISYKHKGAFGLPTKPDGRAIMHCLKSVEIRNFFTLGNLSLAPEGKHARISGRTGANKTTVIGA
jgi:hypothetical protein